MSQLATLKMAVRFGTAQKEVEKDFDASAQELDLPGDRVEELSVPSRGLEAVGLREAVLSQHRSQLAVTAMTPSFGGSMSRENR